MSFEADQPEEFVERRVPTLGQVYTGPERRAPTEDALLSLVTQVHEKVDKMQAALHQHMTEDSLKLANELRQLMDNAFPFGDPHGHRSAHEASIRKAEARAEFWKKMTFELSKWGLFGFLGWAAFHLWNAFLHGPTK